MRSGRCRGSRAVRQFRRAVPRDAAAGDYRAAACRRSGTDVLRQIRSVRCWASCFAAARRDLERRWGCHNLEVPLSRVCRTRVVRLFRLSSAGEPAAVSCDLQRVVCTTIAGRTAFAAATIPFPIWRRTATGWRRRSGAARTGQTRRGRLFARLAGDRHATCASGTEAWPSLPASIATRARAVRAGSVWKRTASSVRSRALTNTLFARLLLADLFIHGIGGGKYDELTDEIMRRFFGFEPPHFVVLSATRLLPLPSPPVSGDGLPPAGPRAARRALQSATASAVDFRLASVDCGEEDVDRTATE